MTLILLQNTSDARHRWMLHNRIPTPIRSLHSLGECRVAKWNYGVGYPTMQMDTHVTLRDSYPRFLMCIFQVLCVCIRIIFKGIHVTPNDSLGGVISLYLSQVLDHADKKRFWHSYSLISYKTVTVSKLFYLSGPAPVISVVRRLTEHTTLGFPVTRECSRFGQGLSTWEPDTRD